jgi:hypothetical protein
MGALDQTNLAGGGARAGDNREGCAEAFVLSRWVRLFLITAGSSLQATIRSAPPQAGQEALLAVALQQCLTRQRLFGLRMDGFATQEEARSATAEVKRRLGLDEVLISSK